MKRRICALTGIGSNQKPKLSNNGKLPVKLRRAALSEYFKTVKEIDYSISQNAVKFGIEATYQWDPIHIITIAKRKEDSYWIRGQAVGAWASKDRTTSKRYSSYVYRSKFVRFVDKWHPVLFGKRKNQLSIR